MKLLNLGSSLSREEMKKIKGGDDIQFCGKTGQIAYNFPLGCCSGLSCSRTFGEPPRCYSLDDVYPCEVAPI
ncbi:hypothetical protein [Pedobacter sp.]|uniref:hypothetical protein n=1 Tax=Pedobacter sp. TaxID=1411316 RepID=UPI00396C87A3